MSLKNVDKKYQIEKNKSFLKWLKVEINQGYDCFLSISEMQNLIDNIVNWYELKYPERELEFYEGILYDDFKNIKSISNVMDINQLLFRLPEEQLNLMNANYRAKGWCRLPNKNGEDECYVSLRMSMKDDSNKISPFSIRANEKTGVILEQSSIKKFINGKKDITLDELLSNIRNNRDLIDYQELEECVNDHDGDVRLRNKLLQLSALKLLYSKNTTLDRGYIRAKRLINEFNKKLGTTLSSIEIDEIISDYNNQDSDNTINIKKR